MITLKHLAREFQLDPYALRMALREAKLEPQINRRWKWASDKESEYLKAKRVSQELSLRLKKS